MQKLLFSITGRREGEEAKGSAGGEQGEGGEGEGGGRGPVRQVI